MTTGFIAQLDCWLGWDGMWLGWTNGWQRFAGCFCNHEHTMGILWPYPYPFHSPLVLLQAGQFATAKNAAWNFHRENACRPVDQARIGAINFR